QSGVQFYSGNFLDGEVLGKNGAVYNKRSGFCLETQAFPNATAFEHFPSIVLKKGDVYKHKTMFKFFSV
ncbi:MAG: galactose-1-epimerase, partial [Lachnospiraceae bacterium]|nr:galactose-1-epimerase [Lachnospiraceae bacterium]